MKVSASTVIYRTDDDELRRCLESLVSNGIHNIWIIDNSPEATDISNVAALFPDTELKYRHLPHNPGYGAAHNCAIREALDLGYEAHLVVNTDIMFSPDTIAKLTRVMVSDANIGQISPRIVSPDGSQQYGQRLLPTPFDVFGRRFLPSFAMKSRNRRYMLTERSEDTPANIPYHQGSFMLFRSEALRVTGGFDERFFMYPEDIDITRRIHQKYTTLYYPSVTITHAHRASSYKSLKMLRVHCLNMIRYFNKWGWVIDRERRAVNRMTLKSMGLTRRGRRHN